jgi:hypothetical protein
MIHPEGETVPVTVRVPKTLIDCVDKLATEEDKIRSGTVSEAIRGGGLDA